MTQAKLIAVFGVGLTVQSTKSPGEGCCLSLRNGYALNESWPSDWIGYDIIKPAGDWPDVVCDLHVDTFEAMSADGQKAFTDTSNRCSQADPAGGPAEVYRYRSGTVMLPDSSVDFLITHYESGPKNGTFDCRLSEGRRLQALSLDDDTCFGPKYHDDQPFVGSFRYGSLRAERFKITPSNAQAFGLTSFIDVDVDNGCLPIASPPYTFSNLDLSPPDDSLFTIPPECSQHSAKASGPVMHPKPFLWAMRSFVLV